MNTSIETLESRTPAKPRASRTKDVLTGGAPLAALVYIVMFALYGFYDHSAFSAYAIASLANNAAPLILAAAGQTVVVLTRGFDLSLVGTISVANVLVAAFPFPGAFGGVASLAMCVAVGVVIGLLNGYLVAYKGIQTIAATLGTMIIFQGIALLILPVPGGSVSEFVSTTLTGTLLGMPITGMIVAVFAGAWLLLRRTDLGIAFYAVGADENAAMLSGIAVKKTRCLAFGIAGVFYGAAGFMLSAQTSTGDPNAGLPFLLLSFAGVALGGTSLGGGQGGLIGSMVGAAVLLLMQKMLFAVGVSSFYTGMFQGLLLIAAILCERGLNRVRRTGASV